MKLQIHIKEDLIRNKVTNDRLGLFISNSWKNYINPYTPRDTGNLMGINGIGMVDIRPWELDYRASYASEVYYNNRGVIFNTELNPYATDHWDHKAAQAGQLNKLYRTANTALRTGRY